MKHLTSREDVIYYSVSLWAILQSISEATDKVYTHHFQYIGRSELKDKPLLRKLLRTMEKWGLVANHDEGFNLHKWSITEKGRLFYSSNSYDKSVFLPMI